MPRIRTTEADELIALRTIRDSLNERGYPPSQREIARACGWASPSGANNLIRLMEAHGLIQVAPGIPRGLRITADGIHMVTGTKMITHTEAV